MDFFAIPGKTQQVFRNFSVYTQGAKWGNAAKSTLEMSMAGGEKFFEHGQYIGTSWGPMETSLSIESFVPVGGKNYQRQIIKALAEGQYAFVTVGEIGKQIIQLGYMVVKSLKVDTDMARGGCVLHVALEGGSADILMSTPALPLKLGGL